MGVWTQRPYPPVVFRSRVATLKDMDRAGGAQRQQLLLWAAVLAVALSLLAMHQLSINHTAADPAAGSSALTLGHADQDKHHAAVTGDHAHAVAPGLDQRPAPAHDGCPGCAEHQAMALTCLAALVLLAVGWALRVPALGRGVLLPRVRPRPLPPGRRWRRTPFTLMELSISRT
jgi:Family of unknown function (DUF6153)